MKVQEPDCGALEQEFREYRERIRLALWAARICIFELNIEQYSYTFVENSEEIFGLSGPEILEKVREFSALSPEDHITAGATYFIHPDDQETLLKAYAQARDGQAASYLARMRKGADHYVWCKVDIMPRLEEGRVTRLVGIITDIDRSKRQQEALQRETETDAFTGLFNRSHAQQQVSEILRESGEQRHALLLLDIDYFKRVNDTYGHGEGDRILVEAANRLRNTFRKSDVLGRFGGDEFIVLMQNIPGRDTVTKRLEKLMTGIPLEDGRLVTASVGIAMYPEHGTDYATLFRKADIALYRAKKRRNTAAFYEDADEQT